MSAPSGAQVVDLITPPASPLRDSEQTLESNLVSEDSDNNDVTKDVVESLLHMSASVDGRNSAAESASDNSESDKMEQDGCEDTDDNDYVVSNCKGPTSISIVRKRKTAQGEADVSAKVARISRIETSSVERRFAADTLRHYNSDARIERIEHLARLFHHLLSLASESRARMAKAALHAYVEGAYSLENTFEMLNIALGVWTFKYSATAKSSSSSSSQPLWVFNLFLVYVDALATHEEDTNDTDCVNWSTRFFDFFDSKEKETSASEFGPDVDIGFKTRVPPRRSSSTTNASHTSAPTSDLLSSPSRSSDSVPTSASPRASAASSSSNATCNGKSKMPPDKAAAKTVSYIEAEKRVIEHMQKDRTWSKVSAQHKLEVGKLYRLTHSGNSDSDDAKTEIVRLTELLRDAMYDRILINGLSQPVLDANGFARKIRAKFYRFVSMVIERMNTSHSRPAKDAGHSSSASTPTASTSNDVKSEANVAGQSASSSFESYTPVWAQPDHVSETHPALSAVSEAANASAAAAVAAANASVAVAAATLALTTTSASAPRDDTDAPDGDDDCCITGSKTVVDTGVTLPHLFHHCAAESKPCQNCYCFVCDRPRSKCAKWDSHAHHQDPAKASNVQLRERNRPVSDTQPINDANKIVEACRGVYSRLEPYSVQDGPALFNHQEQMLAFMVDGEKGKDMTTLATGSPPVRLTNTQDLSLLVPLPSRLIVYGGIICSMPGSGKTAVACALIAREQPVKRTLIVVPQALIKNWEAELDLWAPRLKVIRCYGRIPNCKFKFAEADVVLVTYSTASLDSRTDADIYFERVIVDEADILMNDNNYDFDCRFKAGSVSNLVRKITTPPPATKCGFDASLFNQTSGPWRNLKHRWFVSASPTRRQHFGPLDNRRLFQWLLGITELKSADLVMYNWSLSDFKKICFGTVLPATLAPTIVNKVYKLEMSESQEWLYHTACRLYGKYDITHGDPLKLLLLIANGSYRPAADLMHNIWLEMYMPCSSVAVPYHESIKELIKTCAEKCDEAEKSCPRIMHVRQIFKEGLQDSNGQYKMIIVTNSIPYLSEKLTQTYKREIGQRQMKIFTVDPADFKKRMKSQMEEMLRKYNEIKSSAILITDVSIAGVGHNLQNTDALVQFDPTLDSQTAEQIQGRVARIGSRQKDRVVQYYIHMKGTVHDKLIPMLTKDVPFERIKIYPSPDELVSVQVFEQLGSFPLVTSASPFEMVRPGGVRDCAMDVTIDRIRIPFDSTKMHVQMNSTSAFLGLDEPAQFDFVIWFVGSAGSNNSVTISAPLQNLQSTVLGSSFKMRLVYVLTEEEMQSVMPFLSNGFCVSNDVYRVLPTVKTTCSLLHYKGFYMPLVRNLLITDVQVAQCQSGVCKYAMSKMDPIRLDACVDGDATWAHKDVLRIKRFVRNKIAFEIDSESWANRLRNTLGIDPSRHESFNFFENGRKGISRVDFWGAYKSAKTDMLEGSGLTYETLACLCHMSVAYSDMNFRPVTVRQFDNVYSKKHCTHVVNLIDSDVVDSTIVPMQHVRQPVAPFFYVSIPKLRLTVKTSTDNLALKLLVPESFTLQTGDVYKVKNNEKRADVQEEKI